MRVNNIKRIDDKYYEDNIAGFEVMSAIFTG